MSRTLTHGTSADCPHVQSGLWTRCLGHIDDTHPMSEVAMNLSRGIVALRAQNARLRDALRPFASLYHPDLHDRLPGTAPIYGVNDTEFTAGDLRNALALLAEPAP